MKRSDLGLHNYYEIASVVPPSQWRVLTLVQSIRHCEERSNLMQLAKTDCFSRSSIAMTLVTEIRLLRNTHLLLHTNRAEVRSIQYKLRTVAVALRSIRLALRSYAFGLRTKAAIGGNTWVNWRSTNKDLRNTNKNLRHKIILWRNIVVKKPKILAQRTIKHAIWEYIIVSDNRKPNR